MIFFSGTFGGETLSLAATNVVIDKYKNQDVAIYLDELGQYLLTALNRLIDDKVLQSVFYTSGHPVWSFLHIKEQEQYTTFEIKTFFLQEMFKRGILTLGSHNLSFSHTKADIDNLLGVYQEVLPMVKQHIDNKNLIENIYGDILQSLFKVR